MPPCQRSGDKQAKVDSQGLLSWPALGASVTWASSRTALGCETQGIGALSVMSSTTAHAKATGMLLIKRLHDKLRHFLVEICSSESIQAAILDGSLVIHWCITTKTQACSMSSQELHAVRHAFTMVAMYYRRPWRPTLARLQPVDARSLVWPALQAGECSHTAPPEAQSLELRCGATITGASYPRNKLSLYQCLTILIKNQDLDTLFVSCCCLTTETYLHLSFGIGLATANKNMV